MERGSQRAHVSFPHSPIALGMDTLRLLCCGICRMEAKRPLKAQLAAELAAAADSDQQEAIRAAFAAREKAIEHDIDHKALDVHMCLDVSYNVRLLHSNPHLC